MTFLGDEGRDALIVMHMIVDHKFTLLGPTASVGGFFLGPIYYYFMLPFLWLWKLDPTGPAVMVALFGIATVFMVYKAGKDMFDPVVGIIAASLYALSPLVISYSRSSWNPNLVPFFSISLIFLLWRLIAKGKKSDLFWIGIVLGIGVQLHYLFLFLYVLTGIWVCIFFRSRSYTKYYFWGLVGFLIGYAPFLAFELRHGFPNTISIMRFVMAGKDTGFSNMQFVNNIIDVSFRLFGRLVFRLPTQNVWETSPTLQLFLLVSASWISLFSSVGLILLTIGTLVKTYGIKFLNSTQDIAKSPKAVGWILLCIWFVVCIVLFGLYKRAIYDYYFGIWFALPFLLVGIVLQRIGKLPFGKPVVFIVTVWLLYVNWQARPFVFAPNNQLGQVKVIAKAVLDKTGSKPFNFALITNYNSDHAYRYFFEIWGNKPVTIEYDQADPTRRSVTDQLLVICELSDCKPLGHPLWEIAGFGRAQIAGEWSVPFVRIFKLVHFTDKPV
jgi:4-amino-4-deoxy-L-arabinose transferase-like glycosyltransferase